MCLNYPWNNLPYVFNTKNVCRNAYKDPQTSRLGCILISSNIFARYKVEHCSQECACTQNSAAQERDRAALEQEKLLATQQHPQDAQQKLSKQQGAQMQRQQ
jgi:hypothetical protein